MTKLIWDASGDRFFETGVDQGVLYLLNQTSGQYDSGFAWNGLTTVTESPSGAESNKQYADNIMYLNLLSIEQFGGTVEAYTYPDQFAECDGTSQPEPGVSIGQQPRKPFGLCFRTRKGNDLEGTEKGYKLHLIYNALAAPSEKAYSTINDSPAPIAFSWAISTTPIAVTGYKPTSELVIDSTLVDADALATLLDTLYGTVGSDPSLPLPDDVLALFAGTITMVTVIPPTYDNGTHTITIPTHAGIIYSINGVDKVAGPVVITEDTVVHMRPATGYAFNIPFVDDFFADFS
jgi:hypothetical protein